MMKKIKKFLNAMMHSYIKIALLEAQAKSGYWM
jgi:hypothetical protein